MSSKCLEDSNAAKFVIPICAREQCVWTADAAAGEVGLSPAYFYTVAVGYSSS